MEFSFLFSTKDTGITPLMIAVRENRLVLAERLLDLGCPVNVQAQVSIRIHICKYMHRPITRFY